MIFQGTGCSGFIRIGIENYYDYVRMCIEQTVRMPIKRRQKKNRKKRIIIHPYDVNDVSVIYAFAKLNSIRLKSFEQNVSKYTAYMNSISISIGNWNQTNNNMYRLECNFTEYFPYKKYLNYIFDQ